MSFRDKVNAIGDKIKGKLAEDTKTRNERKAIYQAAYKKHEKTFIEKKAKADLKQKYLAPKGKGVSNKSVGGFMDSMVGGMVGSGPAPTRPVNKGKIVKPRQPFEFQF